VINRAAELCRRLKPVLGRKVDGLWAAYMAESDSRGKAEIEQALELLAAKHLGSGYEPDRSPFPPPPRSFSTSGDIHLGDVSYGARTMYPFSLRSSRLKEHLLVAGRSGSGKTNLTFVLMRNIMARGIKVLALDWKRGYRDLRQLHPDLQVFTIGRDVAPFRFNPLIPPPGCEPNVWIKLIVDVIASAYLGGEGVISLLVAGIEHLYREAGVDDQTVVAWPTIIDLLAWLRGAKLRGRAALWQASAERILLAMTYGEFGAVIATQDNSHVRTLLDHNVVFEMDGLSSSSDRVLFSEALTLYLYRYRLSQGPRRDLTNVVILEEAHNLLLAKQAGSRESFLENSIRMIRQYGMGYIFVDQSASQLSKVAFANSYATIAMSQKLRADIQTMSGAMNLSEEQRDALSTLSIGSAVVRLADEHPEPFLIRVPLCPIEEGAISDEEIRRDMAGCSGVSTADTVPHDEPRGIPPIPPADRKKQAKSKREESHPPSPRESSLNPDTPGINDEEESPPPGIELTREAIRFLSDIAATPLSTTVTRYQRLHLSRRRGNAIRKDLLSAALIESVPIATRSGQVVLYQITEHGRSIAEAAGIEVGVHPRPGLEHTFWAARVAAHYEELGFAVTREHRVNGNGYVDLHAESHNERIAIEIETGKSDIKANLTKLQDAGYDRIVFVATSPVAVSKCQRVVASCENTTAPPVDLLTWLDVS